MSIKKIIAIGIIYIIGWLGWWVLGTTTSFRSCDYTGRLEAQVASLWGVPLTQDTPTFSVQIPGSMNRRWLMPIQSTVSVDIQPDYKKKGLLWYSTYNCTFEGIYTICNTEEALQKIRLHFDFPGKGNTYDEFSVYLDDKRLVVPVNTETGIDEFIELAPTETANFKIHYKTRGMDSWRYAMDKRNGRVQNFLLTATTGFTDVDYTDGSLSPMITSPLENGLRLTWKATDLITNSDIGIIIPEKINPGPLTTRITYFAPVCLLFFFILMATIGIMFRISIHPMHYLFIAAGFFAFHLLLSYMAGHVWIHLAFLLSAVTSVALVTTYLSAALGKEFPWKIAIAGQLFFLVLFSYTFFIKGITGLIIAIGSVVTLGILMKVTAHVDWNEVFQARRSTSIPRRQPMEAPEMQP